MTTLKWGPTRSDCHTILFTIYSFIYSPDIYSPNPGKTLQNPLTIA